MASSVEDNHDPFRYMNTLALPNYQRECNVLSVVLALTILFWMVLFPFVASKLMVSSGGHSKTEEKDENTMDENKANHSKSPKQNNTSKNGSAKQRRGKHKPATAKNNETATPSNNDTNTIPEEEPPSVPFLVLAFAAFGLMASLVYVVMTGSPYNNFVARGVFEVPMLTPDECETLIQISMRVAEQNKQMALAVKEQLLEGSEGALNRSMEGLLWEPAGWQKLRHKAYPTTDHNVITDPFTQDDLQWIQEKLDARMGPTLSRIFGVPESAIRANDMFVVRYDSQYRAHLNNHTDDGDISFTILLSDKFEGGGTQFWNRNTRQPFAHLAPTQVGEMSTFSALINHEGMPTTDGTRIIFVGFLSVDRIDPFLKEQQQRPKLNLFASWLSLPWISTKFKEAYVAADYRRRNGVVKWHNNKYAMALYLDLANVLQKMGDYFAPHHVERLVSDENTAKHLQALDEAYQQQQQKEQREKASWFKGQQIDLDIDGKISAEWSTRQASKNRFMEL